MTLRAFLSASPRRGRSPRVAEEGEFHVLGGEGVAIVEGQTLPQLKFIHQPISTLRPGLRQAGGHMIAGQGFDQRVMEGIEKHKGGGDPGGLGRIEIGGGDRGVEDDVNCPSDLLAVVAFTPISAITAPITSQLNASRNIPSPPSPHPSLPLFTDPATARRRDCRSRSRRWGQSSSHTAARRS